MDIGDLNKNPIRNTSELSGEFFVLAELLKRGYQASFTLGNAKTVDIFASDPKTGKTIKIQVKTNSGKKPRKDNHAKWQVGKKIWDFSEESVKDLIYVFVLLYPHGKDHPIYYIAKAWDVIRQTKEDFERYQQEIKEGKRPYRGNLETPEDRYDYPMKDFYSDRFVRDGYKFLEWDEIFSQTLPSGSSRVAGLHLGGIQTTEDFDAPLPEEFWVGTS